MIGARRLLPPSPRRVMPEPVVPMINVVFLLLIFFLMTAQFTPPPPVEITPPVAVTDPAAQTGTPLFLGRDGTLAYLDQRGASALEAALQAAQGTPALDLHVDAAAPATDLAQLLSDIRAHWPGPVRLITQATP